MKSYQLSNVTWTFLEQPNQESSHFFWIHEFISYTKDYILFTDRFIFGGVSYFTHLYFQNIPYLASHTKEKWENNRGRQKLVVSSIFEYCWYGMTWRCKILVAKLNCYVLLDSKCMQQIIFLCYIFSYCNSILMHYC